MTTYPSPEILSAPASLNYTLYVVVRLDIPLEQQIVQAAHAAAEASRAFYRERHGLARLIVCSVPDLTRLHKVKVRIEAKAIRTAMFHEPDFGIGDSALASEPVCDAQRKYFRGLPLWRPACSPTATARTEACAY